MQSIHIISPEKRKLQKTLGIIGDSEQIQNAIDNLVKVAPTDLSVLITGETGTGKEVFANALHLLSNRRNNPFIVVNTGAIPETLLESELFGHEKGAFTDAKEQRLGFFEAANNGTIFLDEIGEMPISLQSKLLRVLENGEFSRLGSSAIKRVDVRVVAATNRNLGEEIAAKKFRSDLFYRLARTNIELPALREHIQDIPLYFEHFAKSVCKKNKIEYLGIDDNALDFLKTLPWVGNIREFKNFVENVIILEKGKHLNITTIRRYIPQALPAPEVYENANALIHKPQINEIISNETLILRALLDIKQDISAIKNAIVNLDGEMNQLHDEFVEIKANNFTTNANNTEISSKIATLKEWEKEILSQTLAKLNNSKRQTAKVLGITERKLYRMIEEFGL